jgi:RND family efflux transporter MFP subunit
MTVSPKIAAMAVGVVAALSAATLAQDPRRAPAAAPPQTVVVAGGLDWLEKSELSAKREGVIKSIEFNVGMRVQEGQQVGLLHDDIARLSVEKQRLVAASTGPIMKAEAQRQQAMSTLSRLQRLQRTNPGFVSKEEMDKATADVNYADALKQEAEEKQIVDRAEYDLAVQALEDHKIISPFSGVVVDRHKNPGEAVRANEPVVLLGKTDKFRFVGWLPLESALQIRPGDTAQFRPTVESADLPVERQVFNGKVMAIAPQLSTLKQNESSILVEIENPPNAGHPELELYHGMRGEVTIYVNGAQPPRVAGNDAPPARNQ